MARKTAWKLFFLSPQLILQFTEGRSNAMALLQRKLFILIDPEGVQHFPGGGSNFFRGGGIPNANFYKNPYLVIFQGVRTPIPLWIRTWVTSWLRCKLTRNPRKVTNNFIYSAGGGDTDLQDL